MDAFERRTPHYLRIYRDLKRKIAEGAFAPGERLPTQRELAASHGVTVMTVRQALQLLEQEELVVSRHGLGTFVAPQRIRYEIGNLRSLAQEVAAQGLDLRTSVLRRGLVAPHPRVAEVLRVEPAGPVLSIERLRHVGQQRVVYQQSYLPAWLAEALEGVDLGASRCTTTSRPAEDRARTCAGGIHAIGLAAAEAALLDELAGAPALPERAHHLLRERRPDHVRPRVHARRPRVGQRPSASSPTSASATSCGSPRKEHDRADSARPRDCPTPRTEVPMKLTRGRVLALGALATLTAASAGTTTAAAGPAGASAKPTYTVCIDIPFHPLFDYLAAKIGHDLRRQALHA